VERKWDEAINRNSGQQSHWLRSRVMCPWPKGFLNMNHYFDFYNTERKHLSLETKRLVGFTMKRWNGWRLDKLQSTY
jgi:hypothetical protein